MYHVINSVSRKKTGEKFQLRTRKFKILAKWIFLNRFHGKIATIAPIFLFSTHCVAHPALGCSTPQQETATTATAAAGGILLQQQSYWWILWGITKVGAVLLKTFTSQSKQIYYTYYKKWRRCLKFKSDFTMTIAALYY